MNMKTHVKASLGESTSKLIFQREWNELNLDNLNHCLIPYGVSGIRAEKEIGSQVRIKLTYKTPARSLALAQLRAEKADAFIGGWMAAMHPSFGQIGKA